MTVLASSTPQLDFSHEQPSSIGVRGPSAEELRIREALTGNNLSTVFQPIVDLRRGSVVGAEALARFRTDPYRTPDVWFNEAWSVGLGMELELLAIQRALESLERMPFHTYLSVNVAPQTLLSPGLTDLIATVPGERIMVELTEHEVVADYDAMSRAIARLRAMRTRLAIDDAGAGFSSFQHILRLRPDIIKLDRSLTSGVDANPVRFALASALVTFAGSLGASICAEGIETASELAALQRLGIVYGQGYFLGRPGALPLAKPPDGVWLGRGGLAQSEAPPSKVIEIGVSAAPQEPAPELRSSERLAKLEASGLMDSAAEESFDALTRLAATVLSAPIALVSLIDAERTFFKSTFGLTGDQAAVRTLPLSYSLCQHAVATKAPFIVDDSRQHPLVRDNLAVTELGVVAYAGVPLITADDNALGALCVIDPSPRAWTERDIAVLSDLAKVVLSHIERGFAVRELEGYRALSDTLFSHTGTAFMLCDIRGRIVRKNKEVLALLGYAPGELLNRHIATIKHPDDIHRDFMLRDAMLAGGDPNPRVQTRFLRGDGSWLTVQLTASIVRSPQGKAGLILLSLEDATTAS